MNRAAGDELRFLNVVGLLGLVAVVIGLNLVPPLLTFTLEGTVSGVASQLPTTAPAAGLMIAATAANVLAGAVVMNLIRGRRFSSPAELVVGGFVGAVLLDIALLYVLAGVGAFALPLVAIVIGGLLAVGAWQLRPSLPGASIPIRVRPSLLHLFIAIAWSGAVVLQLASPIVPFGDVLPNHVAPVEHLRTFSSFDPLTTSPSPVYGPSRTSIGYVGLLGTLAVLTALPAALGVAAFILPQLVLLAAGLRLLTRRLAGARASLLILLTFALAQPFLRVTDVRARVVALVLVAWTLVELLRLTGHGLRRNGVSTRPILGLAVALGATVLMHAVIGLFTAATIAVLVAAKPGRYASAGVPALGGALGLALPQAATMLGISVPSPFGIASIPLAVATTLAIARFTWLRTAGVAVARLALGGSVLLFVVFAAHASRAIADLGAALLPTMTVLGATTVIGIVVAPRRVLHPLLAAALGVGLLAGAISFLIPGDTPSILLRSIRFEIPKEVQTWIPSWLAISSAIALDALLRTPRNAPALTIAARRGVTIAFVLLAVLPLRLEEIGPFHVGEHRVSESLATQFMFAEDGFWRGYPDARRLIDREQESVLAAIQEEIRAGRIAEDTRLLHVAADFQVWASTPVGVFLEVLETSVSVEPEVSIHTAGGRLHSMAELDALLHGQLADAHHDYVLLEPGGLPDVTERIVSAGYEQIFTNERGKLYRAASIADPP